MESYRKVPSLFWVLVTLAVVVYVSALAMRATVLNLSGSFDGPGGKNRFKALEKHAHLGVSSSNSSFKMVKNSQKARI